MNRYSGFHRLRDFENIQVTSIGRTSAHPGYRALESEEQAVRGGQSRYRISLSGQYDFAIYPRPEDADEFWRPGYDASPMVKITVPGNWETQGFDEPIYTNIDMPWDKSSPQRCNIEPNLGGKRLPNPPYIPEHNPTGCYRRTFTVPDCFAGREVYLCFEGVETAYYLWLNGEPVGYSQDSKLPSEFCVTPYLQPGENLLALQVMRFADSTYLEDQDYWYLSGIYRDVWLIAKPALSIQDYTVTAVPDLHTLQGTLRCEASVTRRDGFADHRLRAAVYDGDRLLAEGTAPVMPEAQYRTDAVPTANTARVTLSLDNVELWTPETPKLYTVVLSLLTPEGETADVEACRTGFRTLEIQNGVVLFNGCRLLVKGVNRHEHCPQGRAVTSEHMLEEIRQMKRMNINSVRTCHYPDSPLWYDLCDEYGLLLICECNLETHAVNGQLTHNPDYAGVFLERAVRMVKTHKNHVSIYSWSLGNESGTGPNHAAMAGFIREYDPTRLCQYEAGEPGKSISDIRGNMYASQSKILDMLTDPRDSRPIILVEYLYQIANSGGGIRKFQELTEKYERFQGGYVWDWQDKCLDALTPEGKPFYAYGGDFAESYTDPDQPLYMTCNGIVQPNLRWKPVACALREVYSTVLITRVQAATVWDALPCEEVYRVKNNSMVNPLSDFTCRALLRENGTVVAEEAVELPPLPPLSAGELHVTLPYEKKPGCEYHLDLAIRRKIPAWFEDAGDRVCTVQFALSGGGLIPSAIHSTGTLNVSEDSETVTVSGGDFEVVFSRTAGELLRASKGGRDYLTSGGRPCFTRPLTGITPLSSWDRSGSSALFRDLTRRLTAFSVLRSDNAVCVLADYAMEKDGVCLVTGTLRYTVYAEGQIETEFIAHIYPEAYNVPRVGVELTVPAGFESLRYFGYGETETYCDRRLGAVQGIFESTVEGQHFPFIPPSENGGHEETRWLTLADKAGHTLRLTGRDPFHFDIHHNTVEDYLGARHEQELTRRPESTLHIDAAHGPIGGDMAWSSQLDESLVLKGGRYYTGFLIELL